ncbi:MAG: hypothetical protein IKO85_01005 [Bacteroidaceae bacterium]|nr:hypothetical protein [Bacteroidaceae bacterium]
MQTNYTNTSRWRLWLWPQGRDGSPNGGFGRWFFLLTLLVTAVTGVKADGYITDLIVIGNSDDDQVRNLRNQYTNDGWTVVNKDLNANAGGWDIYLAYKKSTDANPETGYITDICTSTKNVESFTFEGRTYYKAPATNFNGDLNRDAGGKDIFLYYTRSRYGLENSSYGGSKRVITGINTTSKSDDNDDATGCVQWRNASLTGSCDVNESAGGDDIYLQQVFTEQTLTIKNHPEFATDLTFNGSALNLVPSTPENYGTIKYRVNGGSWSNSATATNVGTYTVEYYLDGGTFANNSDTYTKNNVVIAPPLVKAATFSSAFSQLEKKVTLNWSVGSIPGNYADYNWVVYRGNDKIATLNSGVTIYTDTHFANEEDVTYNIYYVPSPFDISTKRDDCKAVTTVNTTRSVPVNNLQAVSSEDKVTLTWTSVAFLASANMNNKFDVYIDGVKVVTITPAEGQTSFKWEHRDANGATERINYTQAQTSEAGLDAYSTEELDACNLHTYRVVGQIDDKELNSGTVNDKSIGAGTTYENFVCSKGDNQGSVLLTWNVRRLAHQTQAETYIIERRVMKADNDDEGWQKLTTLDSDKTFMTWEDKTPLPGVFYEYRVTVYNWCENGNRPATTAYDTGFALSSGVISGRITYGTGTAVENVKVTLRQNNDDGETVSHLRSLQFTGTGTGMLCTTTTKDLKKLIGGDFSIQAYVNPSNAQMNGDGTAYVLYDISSLFAIVLKYNATQQAYQLGAYINGENRFTDQYIPANKWSHVNCVYSKSAQSTTFYVTTDADHIASGSITGQTVATATNETGLALGNSVTMDNANNFGGYLDEFRFFKRALSQNDIRKNFNHPMGGTESDLAIYYPMDENMGVQNIVYDFSKSNNASNGHHATAHVPAVSSGHIPTEEQLSLMGLTDGQGNFVIRGVPFSGEGTNYTIIPTMGIHEFSPAYLSRYVSASSLVHNSVDFEDVSSFPVSGTVRYANTDYPVEGCNIYVDGQICSKDGKSITTNSDGSFNVSVPIGDHYLQIVKSGHVFASAGRYPADPNETGMLHTFDQKITGLEFIDETLVNFTGRVVGGSIEGDKPVGFGQSKNNIGVVELVLSPINELYRMNVVKNVTETTSSLDTNSEELPVASATSNIKSTSVRGATADYCKKIFIRTDASTGEFSAMLPPLQYKIESMKVKKNGSDVGEATTIDLTNPQTELVDTIRDENGELLSYSYNTILKKTFHSAPSFSVEQQGRNDGSFGISSYTLTDAQGKVEINDIYSVDGSGNVTYKYGGPIFIKEDPYTFLLKGYEEYTNPDGETEVTSRVPLKDVIVTINNALSSSQSVYVEDGEVDGAQVVAGQVVELKSNQILLNEDGEAEYTWKGGLPNVADPYSRTISMTYEIDGRSYQWNEGGIEGIVLGDLPTGNNFVTQGPDKLLMILRDPPGSASSAEWSTGSSTSKTKLVGSNFTVNSENTFQHKFGAKDAIIVGTPGSGTITEAESKDDLTIGAKMESEGENATTKSTTITLTQAVATKGEPEYVGHYGDVFIGTSTNVVFGNARNVTFTRAQGGEPTIGVEDCMVTNMRFGTMFNYTLKYIEEDLFPNFIKMRNSLLNTVSESDYNKETHENTTGKSIYITMLTPDDEDYGEEGTYKFIPPTTNDGQKHVYENEVMWVNNQIENWITYLALNEEEKVKAYQNRTDETLNLSFDSGSDVSRSKETEAAKGSSWEWTVKAGATIQNEFGFSIRGFGIDASLTQEALGGKHESTEKEESETTSFSYTLSETGDADALTVDVYEYGKFSPIFRTRAGQTSAPYEGEVRTKYYVDENGDHPVIMEATMQIEVPQIDVETAVVSDVPSGQAANYVLKLSNASETGADVAYRLMMLDDTNSEGVQLTMDGMPLTGEGRLIKVPGSQTLTKALQLRQTDTSVLDYENIGIVFASDSEPDDIFDDVYITAHFTPSSSAVDLALSNSTMNTQTGTDLKLTFNNFDRNYKNLKAFRLQYKKQGSTDWTQLHEYVLDENAVTQNNELLPAGASIDYTLDMNQFTDGDYLFRVLSVATYGTGEVYRSSEELALVKDMQRPRPLGQPEPADGVLSAGDELSVTFNETILKGELTQAANFKVTGVLNGAEVAHETALSMQNTDVTAQTEDDIMLAGKNFSIDAWMNLTGGEGTLLSHGKGKGNAKMTVGTDDTNHLVVKIGSETYTSDNIVPTGAWVFLTMNYNAGKLTAKVAKDADETVLFSEEDVVTYEGNGPLTVGKNMTGAIHELLLWDEAHDMTEALLQRSRTKNPATRHLIGYWKMDEGEGTTIRDYSRNRHMTMGNETWYMNNVNKAVSLTGGQYLSVDASALPAYDDDDYALEFWMRGEEQGAAQLLQMGEVGLWLNGNGELQLTGKGAYLDADASSTLATTSGTLTDNAWHHIALNVLRQGAAAVYVDGVRRLTTNAANVGSIATNNLLMGTHRKTLSEHGEYSYDRPFTGEIDELRVWNATLNADKLLSTRKVRLTGSEDGLVAYYPFETKELDQYSQTVTVGTDADLCGSGKTATVSSGEIAYSGEAPALRAKQTEVNVPFTFVASNEKIVITIDEDPATIEGCTLNFTVRDVRDENGNYSMPAVWSAFVNKNQLVWSENSLSAELRQTTTTTLTASVVNKGGQQQMWTLTGLPAWLEASVENGETNPLSETKVEFTILPSAPLGRNEVTVYLTGNDNIDTPLTLNIKVTGDVPDWAVNPNAFESSMNVIGQLVIDNVASEDADDILAAFIGEECRGIVHPQYNERYGGSYITMDIYGNSDETGNVTFRAYNASTGITYPVVKMGNAESVSFVPLSLSGSYAEPAQFTAQDLQEQKIELKAGWNWISFYVAASDMTIPALFEKVAADVLTVKSQTEYLDYNNVWAGSLTSGLSTTEMYAVKMNADRTLRVVGTKSNSKATIYEGWNWVGYNGSQAASLSDALSGMTKTNGDIVKAQSGVAYWDGYEWAGSLLLMEPGKGYQIKSNAKASAGVKASDTSELSDGMSFMPVNFRKYPDNAIMAVKVVLNGQSLNNIELGVFDGEECRTAAVTNGEGMAYLTIPGDETCELTVKVANGNEVSNTPLTFTYESDAEYGTPSNPIVLELGTATGIHVISDGADDAIYDLSGRKIVNSQSSSRKLQKGVYIINGQKKTVK